MLQATKRSPETKIKSTVCIVTSSGHQYHCSPLFLQGGNPGILDIGWIRTTWAASLLESMTIPTPKEELHWTYHAAVSAGL